MTKKYQPEPDAPCRPGIKLKPGETGKITSIGIYPDESVIYGEEFDISLGICGVVRVFESDTSPVAKLANYSDEELLRLAQREDLPFTELQELRDLEKEYRDSLAAAAAETG